MLMTIKSLHKTFYSAPFYRELLTSWKGIGLGFLFLITLINGGQLAYYMHEPLSAFMDESESFFAALPEVEITGGIVKAEGESPQKLTLLKNYQGTPVAVLFDTMEEAADAETLSKRMESENLFVMVNKNAVSIYNAENKKIDIRTTADMKDNKITHEQWVKLGQDVRSTVTPLTLLTLFGVLFFAQIFIAYCGGLLLFIIAPLFKVKAPFKGCIRLTSAAKVPVAVLFIILPPQTAIQVLIWFGFAVFGLLASRTSPTRNEST